MIGSNPTPPDRENIGERQRPLPKYKGFNILRFLLLSLMAFDPGATFDRSLEREPETPAPQQNEPVNRIKEFLKKLRGRAVPAPQPAPAYVSTFRLSRDEVIVLKLISDLGVPAGVSLKLACEWGEAIRLGDQYPYRRPDDPYLICSIGLKEVFKYEDGGEP